MNGYCLIQSAPQQAYCVIQTSNEDIKRKDNALALQFSEKSLLGGLDITLSRLLEHSKNMIDQHSSLPTAAESNKRERETKEETKNKRRKRGSLNNDQRAILTTWLESHINNPYPTETEKLDLIKATNLERVQLENWMVNTRKRRLLQREGRVLPPQSQQKRQFAQLLEESLCM
jgi:hypothetical protein